MQRRHRNAAARRHLADGEQPVNLDRLFPGHDLSPARPLDLNYSRGCISPGSRSPQPRSASRMTSSLISPATSPNLDLALIYGSARPGRFCDTVGRWAAERIERHEIGSASCRERVCQYVSLSVVAGSLTKNKQKKHN